MFYRKIDLKKLYENTGISPDLDGDDMPVGADDVSSEEAVQHEGDLETLKKQKMSGRMYAWPIGSDVEQELRSIAASGAGVWSSPEPLKLWADGKDGEAAMIGDKPVYLRVKVTANKSDKHNPVESEPDREYVVYTTSSDELTNALDTAVNITNSVRVAVTTPFLKSGVSTEHSLEMWRSEEVIYHGGDNLKDAAEKLDLPDPAVDSETPIDISVDVDAHMEHPGTPAGISESNKYFFSPQEVDRMVGSILENIEYKLIRKTSAGNTRWLLDVTNNKAYYISSPDKYKQLISKLKLKGSSTPLEDGKVELAIANAGKATADSFLTPVTPTASTKKSSGSKTVDGTISDIIKTKRSLRRGRNGEAVKALQEFLGVEADGKFGPGTDKAVKAWQKENGLTEDGIVGPNTAKKIVDIIAKKEEPKKEEVKKEEPKKEEVKKEEPKKEEVKKEEPKKEEEEESLDDMSLEELEKELEDTKGDLKDAKRKKRKNRKADRKKKRLIKKINRKKKKEEKFNESVIYSFDDFMKMSNGLQDNLDNFFNGKK